MKARSNGGFRGNRILNARRTTNTLAVLGLLAVAAAIWSACSESEPVTPSAIAPEATPTDPTSATKVPVNEQPTPGTARTETHVKALAFSPAFDADGIVFAGTFGGGGVYHDSEDILSIADSFFSGNEPDHVGGRWTDVGGNEFLAECCAADLNDDGSVGVQDLTEVILTWGGSDAADVNGDGTVDVQDLTAVVLGWGACGG